MQHAISQYNRILVVDIISAMVDIQNRIFKELEEFKKAVFLPPQL